MVRRAGDRITLQSPAFLFQLDIGDGLRAEQWENRLSHRTLQLGHGPEVGFDIGLPGRPATTPRFKVTQAPAEGRTPGGEACFELVAEKPKATITVCYRWDERPAVLHKSVTIRNDGTAAWDRLLDVRLGTYVTDAAEYHDADWPVRITKSPASTEWAQWPTDPAGHERGYPAYPEDQFFVGLAHPSGFATLERRQLRLVQHPGLMLEANQSFTCMETVYGVAPAGGARDAFCDYLRSRMRRVLRGHAQPYAILDTCGAQPVPPNAENFFAVSEPWCLDHIARLDEGQREAGLHWDYYSIEFWHDSTRDLMAPDAKRFPDGFAPIFNHLAKLGTLPGLWISSGCFRGGKTGLDPWTFGQNPVVLGCGTDEDGNHGYLCRSAGPVNRMYIEGLVHQVRANGVRLIKLDVAGEGGGADIYPLCNNPHHGHLPGDYSIEANQNAQIELLTALDKECPDLFIMLYWGHRSPWWLLYGDTLFDVGMRLEMASLDVRPTLYARSSNVRRLDQTRRMVKDLPALGYDSLGVALSQWSWNNRLGSERWQEGVLMDICRGALLTHIWSDPDCFSPADRPQMAEFISLLKARPTAFINPHFIGDARTDAVWGYCCTDGQRTMISLDNGSWADREISLQLNSQWGLPNHGRWDLYSWYPHHARLVSEDGKPFGAKASITLRPFTAVLLELVPTGGRPALARSWEEQGIPARLVEKSREVAIATASSVQGSNRAWNIAGEIPPSKTGGWFAITTEFRRDGQPFLSVKNKPASLSATLMGQPADFQAVLDNARYAAPWQTYRLRVAAAEQARPFTLATAVGLPQDVEVVFTGHFVPAD